MKGTSCKLAPARAETRLKMKNNYQILTTMEFMVLKHLRHLMLMFAIFSCVSVTHAQNTTLKLDTRSAISPMQYIKEMPKSGTIFAYSQTGFLNSTFYGNRSDKLIKNGNSLEMTYFLRLWLFRLDVGGFYGYFNAKSSAYHTAYKTETASYIGVNSFVNFLPMPYWGKISEIIVPSFGVGYQTASLKATEKDNYSSDAAGSLGVGGPMFKACLQINFGRNFFLHTEYRQGLNVSSNKAPYTLAFGIGGRF